MYLKELSINKEDGTEIRKITFHNGLNLIVDETPVQSGKETGNNVGKTTVLKLIDFCLGAKAKDIYTDNENQKNEYLLVKNFLIENKIIIGLVLTYDITDEKASSVLIERNFLSRNKKLQSINGENLTEIDFERGLTSLLFPEHFDKKPTFRQIASHNIRYTNQSLENTLKTLDKYTTNVEYETLYLFLLGVDFSEGDAKQNLSEQIKIEEKFKKRLEESETRSGYEAALSVVDSEIRDLEKQKTLITINPNFEEDLDTLNNIKFQINSISSVIGNLELKRNLIFEAQQELEATSSNIDLNQLHQIYNQATRLVENLQKTFEDMVSFHNTMIQSKINFISKDLPNIEEKLKNNRSKLDDLLIIENELNSKLLQSDNFGNLEDIITALNNRYRRKGEYENVIRQIKSVDERLLDLNSKLSNIDDALFSEEYRAKIQEQVNKLNHYFSNISNELYNEKYAIKFDEENSNGKRLYKFSAFNTNFSSGKKQGEISCFDLAYTAFADAEEIPCMHFLLNDKKELMHDNQLIKICNYIDKKNIQFVASILKDKLPSVLNDEKYFVVKLSQEDKLFRIENSSDKDKKS